MSKTINNIKAILSTQKWMSMAILFIIVVLPTNIQSQTFSNPFHTINDKKVLIYGIDNRRTHISKHNTLIYGLYLGIGFGGKLRFKVGISATPFEKGKFIDSQGNLKRNKLFFAHVGEEFDFFMINKLRLTTYIQAGYGFNYFRIVNQNNAELQNGKNLIIPIELGLQVSYDFKPWLRAKLGFGWRFVFPYYSYDLSGYYIKTGCSINPKMLYEKIKSKRNNQNMKIDISYQ
ncbi:MAG: hypothetical protein JNM51_10595 [Bacteroidia bacterium]|nr:hypothetical protein [Bacteroidia bacterium]